jgi:hypothetical protein
VARIGDPKPSSSRLRRETANRGCDAMRVLDLLGDPYLHVVDQQDGSDGIDNLRKRLRQ